MSEHECTKCGETCAVEGDFPKFFAWCHTCGDYAEGFDVEDAGADYVAGNPPPRRDDSLESSQHHIPASEAARYHRDRARHRRAVSEEGEREEGGRVVNTKGDE